MKTLEEKILNIARDYYHYLMSLSNVNGIGLGLKSINGYLTNEPCIHVLVDQKIRGSYVNCNNRIPKYYMGLKTDVIKTGKLKPFSTSPITKRYRPLQGGCSIAAGNGDENGTLGCIVQRGILRKEYFILSNNHVMSVFGENPIGSDIFQPGPEYGGTSKDIVAYLSEVIPLKFERGIKQPVNFIDCAISKINNKGLLSKMILKIGNIKGVNKAILNEKAKKTGFTTSYTEGIVKTIGATRTIDFGPNKNALFKEQILLDLEAKPGDSGSVILNKNNEAIALLMGGSEDMGVTIANDINTVLKKLNVEIYK